jgi:hypothetical protein
MATPQELREQYGKEMGEHYSHFLGGTFPIYSHWLESHLVSKIELAERWEGELFNARKKLSDLQEEIEGLKKIEDKWNAVKDLFDIDKTAKYNIIKCPSIKRKIGENRDDLHRKSKNKR